MIDSCERALIAASTDQQYKVCANFLLIKLSLFVTKERFGCDLTCFTKSDPVKIA